MELRTIDPRTIKANPNNPRRTKAAADADAQLAANIKAIGVIQPPLVKETGGSLEIIAGERRVKAAIAAGLAEIHVLVNTEDDGADGVRSLAENVQRAQMGPVDQWRAIEGLCGMGWSESAIAVAFSFTVRTIQKLRLLAKIHPAMLDAMAFDLPNEGDLRTIAAASLPEQQAVWKRHKPKRGHSASWFEIGRVLHKTRISAKVARFDAETAEAFGIHYEEDLFAPAGEDSRSTVQVDEFFAAQLQWLETNLPPNGTILEVERWGGGKLPPKAERVYGKAQAGDCIGFYIDQNTAEVKETPYRLIRPTRSSGRADDRSVEDDAPRAARPEVSRKGVEMIGALRTDALHQGLREADFDDGTLLGMLVLALGGSNVSVNSPGNGYHGDRANIAARLMEGGHLSADLSLIREAGREMLVQVLSCKEGMSKSGLGAMVAGTAIDADRYLVSMANEDFLKLLSKAGIERAAREAGVLLLPKTGKEMRAALIGHVANQTYVLPEARFALTAADIEELKPLPTEASDDADETDEAVSFGEAGSSGEEQGDHEREDDDALSGSFVPVEVEQHAAA